MSHFFVPEYQQAVFVLAGQADDTGGWFAVMEIIQYGCARNQP